MLNFKSYKHYCNMYKPFMLLNLVGVLTSHFVSHSTTSPTMRAFLLPFQCYALLNFTIYIPYHLRPHAPLTTTKNTFTHLSPPPPPPPAPILCYSSRDHYAPNLHFQRRRLLPPSAIVTVTITVIIFYHHHL